MYLITSIFANEYRCSCCHSEWKSSHWGDFPPVNELLDLIKYLYYNKQVYADGRRIGIKIESGMSGKELFFFYINLCGSAEVRIYGKEMYPGNERLDITKKSHIDWLTQKYLNIIFDEADS